MPVNYNGTADKPYPAIIRVELREISLNDQTAGEDFAQYDTIYQSADALWYRTDAFNTNRVPRRGVGLSQDNPAGSGELFDVWIRGLISNNSWNFVSGAPVYVGSGVGTAPVMSAPTASGVWQYLIGKAITSSLLDFDPSDPIQIAQ